MNRSSIRLRLCLVLAVPLLGAACHRGAASSADVSPTPGSAQRVQVFSTAFTAASHGPEYVWLDSGVTYRLQGGGPVRIRPRMAGAPPIRFSTTMVPGGQGMPFQAPVSGEYRVDSDYHGPGVINVRIVRESADAASAACVADPSSAGCRGAPADTAGTTRP